MEEFPNPQQQEPGTQRRLLLAFVLTFAVLLLMQPLLKKYGPQPAQQEPTQKQVTPGETPGAPQTSPIPEAGPREGARGTAPLEVKQAAAESETVLENELYRIAFSNRGAQVMSWVLKKYDDHPGGKPLELVHAAAAEKYGYPLSLWAHDEGLRKKLSEALYVVTTRDEPGEGGHLRRTVSFEYSDQEVAVRKSVTAELRPEVKTNGHPVYGEWAYTLRLEAEVLRNGQHVQAFPAWPAGFGDQTAPASFAAAKIEYLNGGKIQRLAPDKKGKDISGGRTLEGPFQWAGVSGQYFGAVFLPDEPQSARLVMLRHALEIPKDPRKPEGEKQHVEMLGAAVGSATGVTRERVFVGPKALDVLEAVRVPAAGAGGDLTALVDFGTYLGFIAKPLFLWLKWTYEHWVSNWGWSILILTLIITVALLPLRISSIKSTMKMAKLQPQMKAIQEKYKKYKINDPRKQEMQKEISALYKQEGVNPVGGCLPMMLQLPFLIAFYSMLGAGIELRHASWLWVKDLSSPDPYYVLPVLVVVSMYLMQKMTPQAGMDPVQQKMMNVMMPLMIGFFAWSLASGLSLYWFASNLLGIGQQVVMNRTSFGREMREHMEKQARKREKK